MQYRINKMLCEIVIDYEPDECEIIVRELSKLKNLFKWLKNRDKKDTLQESNSAQRYNEWRRNTEENL